jgi:hypothetical protein
MQAITGVGEGVLEVVDVLNCAEYTYQHGERWWRMSRWRRAGGVPIYARLCEGVLIPVHRDWESTCTLVREAAAMQGCYSNWTE